VSIFDEVTPDEEEEVIRKVYEAIRKRKLHLGALLILRGFSPLAPVAGALGRFFLGPLTPFMGHREEKYIWTLEKPENLRKLIEMLEKDEAKRSSF